MGPVLCPRLREELLRYLQPFAAESIPGADGIMIEDVLDLYPAALAVRKVPDRDEMLRLRPDLAQSINAFFGDD